MTERASCLSRTPGKSTLAASFLPRRGMFATIRWPTYIGIRRSFGRFAMPIISGVNVASASSAIYAVAHDRVPMR
jgi:hypothetical protein